MRGWRRWQVAPRCRSAKGSAGVQRLTRNRSTDANAHLCPKDFHDPMLATFTFLSWLGSLGLPGLSQVSVTRMVVSQEIILRVPVVRPRLVRPVRWTEKKGPKCIASGQIVAAALADQRSIDFLLRDRTRIRAKMDEDCPTLDFYGNFYIQPRDERICAKREEIKSRMGASCRIQRFRRMVPDF